MVVLAASSSVCTHALLPFNVVLQTALWTSACLPHLVRIEVYGLVLRQCIKNSFETKVDLKNIDYISTFLYALQVGMIMCQSFNFLLFFFYGELQLSSL